MIELKVGDKIAIDIGYDDEARLIVVELKTTQKIWVKNESGAQFVNGQKTKLIDLNDFKEIKKL